MISWLKERFSRRSFITGALTGVGAAAGAGNVLAQSIQNTADAEKVSAATSAGGQEAEQARGGAGGSAKALVPPEFKVDSPAKVWFLPTETQDPSELAILTAKVFAAAGFGKFIGKDGLVAVKQHWGAKNNEGYIRPQITKKVGELVKASGGRPILVETNTVYKGARGDSYNHLEVAREHGFTHDSVGFPMAIMDGIVGQNQRPVAIPGVHFKQVNMVTDIPYFDSMVILSHLKGHTACGMGGAIKNLGMGFSSRGGKLAQHSDFVPEFKRDKCVLCGLCVGNCPVNALAISSGKVEVDTSKCIGCGQCLTACRFDAIAFKFGQGSRPFSEKLAEHAFGAIIFHNRKTGFINYFNHVSKFCDCFSIENPVIHKNIGIFASHDPVAVDKACYDVALTTYGKDVFKEMWPEQNALDQLNHAEKIGMGTQKYELITV